MAPRGFRPIAKRGSLTAMLSGHRRRMRELLAGASLAAIAIGIAACGSSARDVGFDAPTGRLIGRVRLAPGAALPAYTPFDLARRPLHAAEPEIGPAACAQALERARQPVAADAERLLSGVVVAASDFARVASRPPREHVVAIEDCRLQPVTIAATEGDRLAIENRDAFAFEPLIGPSFRARRLSQGQRTHAELTAGVDAVLCSRRAPCGRTDLVVFHHPVHAVTSARGEFRIENFPAAELVRVTAWHPLFEQSETFIWVDPGETATVELTLSPKPRFVPRPVAATIAEPAH